MSPYAEDVFKLSKPYRYEYGNIRILQHLKVNMSIIAIEKEKLRLADEEAAQVERDRLEKELADEEERKGLANRSSFANLTSGAFDKMGGLFGANKKKERPELTEWHQSMDYDGEESVEEGAEDIKDNSEQQKDEEVTLQQQEADNKKAQSKLAKSLKFWGS